MEVALGATLIEALQELDLPYRDQPLQEPAASLWSAAAEALEHQWAGWSDLLQQATDVAARGPASAEEPSQAGFDMDVRWDDRGEVPGWQWSVSVSVVDTDGNDVGIRDWQAASPAEALTAALADAHDWYRPVSAEEGWA